MRALVVASLGLLLIATMVSASQVRGAADGAPASGSFTEAQASRGKRLYLERCADCHGATFQPDDFAPGLTGAAFDWRWKGRTVYDLFATIQATMPPGEGRSLGAKATVDVVSYLLRANGFPAGAKELAPDEEALQQLRLTR